MRAQRIASRMAGTGGLMVAVAGWPLAAAVLVGWPLPRRWPSGADVTEALSSRVTDAELLDALTVVGWLIWALFVAAIVAETVSQLRGRPARQFAGPLQVIAAQLVALVIIGLASSGVRHGGGGHPAAPPGGLSAVEAALRASPAPDPRTEDPSAAVRVVATSDSQTPAQVRSDTSSQRTEPHIVRRGDTLWGLAPQHRWKPIWEENRGRAEPGGRHFVNPNVIDIGWTVDLPVAEPRSDAPGAPPAAPAPRPPAAAPTPPTPPPAEPAEPTFRLAPAAPTVPGQSAETHTGSGAAAAQAPATAASGTSILLPLGGAVGVSLALAVAAAVARARVHERRRWRPGATSTQVDRLVTPTIDTLQRAAWAARGGQPPPVLETLLEEVPGRVPVGPAAPCQDASDEHPADATDDGATSRHSAGAEVHVDIDHLGGVALDGPGGQSALRALVTSMLSTHGEYSVEVIVVGAAAPLLTGIERIPGVRIEPDPTRAPLAFEAACLRGARELLDRGARDCMETATSDSPMGVTLIVVVAEDVAGLEWSLPWELAGRRGVAVLCAGAADAFTTATVGEDGTLEGAARERLGGVERLHVLAEEEAAALFAALAGSRDIGVQPEAADGSGAFASVPVPAEARGLGEEPRVVDLRLFGRPRVLVRGAVVETGVPGRGLQILTRLAFARDGLSSEELLDCLWGEGGEVDVERHDLNAANSRTRLRLSELAGERLEVVEHRAGVFRLDAGEVDVDVWRFERALEDARRASDRAGLQAALERAVGEVTGEPLQGLSMRWADGVTARLRDRALDVLVQLADVREAEGDADEEISLLERALTVNPVAEHVVRRLMRVEDRCGRPDAAARVYRELVAELRSLGVRFAEEETERLMEEIASRGRAISVRGLAAAGQAGLSVVGESESASPGR